MKRLLVLLFVAVAAAAGIWYGLRGNSALQSSSADVTRLLPKETLAFVYVPDFKRAREQWHGTDLYKLWREPAMQDFLQKPLTKVPRSGGARQKLQDMAALEMTDAFLAVTAFDEEQPKVVAGFHFKGSAADAEKVIGQWRTRLAQDAPPPKHETVAYEGHQIETESWGTITAATVYDGDWFFAANDIASLKTLLDRADKRLKDDAILGTEENFKAATRHMPSDYAAFVYARLDQYIQKLYAKFPPEAEGNKQTSILRQIHGVAAATSFADGKIRDVIFVAMPKIEGSGELTRSSLTLATQDSFLYLASFLNLPEQLTGPQAAANAPAMAPAAVQRLLSAFAAKGVTRADWDAAFTSELGVIGDWPENARLPAIFAAVSVKDAAKAGKIVEALTATAPEGEAWTKSEKDGVQYYSQPSANPMVPVSPTIGLSNQLLVLGLNADAVESAIKRGAAGTSALAVTDSFKQAEKLVPAPKQSFVYVDAALLYRRLDAAVRPMLVMAAAFMPKIADTVDLNKLPEADVITRHLSPLVMSQRYERDGYVTESVGPVSVYEAAIGLLGATGAGAAFYQQQIHGNAGAPAPATMGSAAPPALPSPTPSQSPEESASPAP